MFIYQRVPWSSLSPLSCRICPPQRDLAQCLTDPCTKSWEFQPHFWQQLGSGTGHHPWSNRQKSSNMNGNWVKSSRFIQYVSKWFVSDIAMFGSMFIQLANSLFLLQDIKSLKQRRPWRAVRLTSLDPGIFWGYHLRVSAGYIDGNNLWFIHDITWYDYGIIMILHGIIMV